MARLAKRVARIYRRVGTLTFVKLAAIVLLVIAGYESYMLYKISTINQLIANGVAADYEANTAPELVFARAFRAEQDDRIQEALELYNTIENSANPRIVEQSKYNTGTLFLQGAANRWNELGVFAYAEVDTLVNLAEENFRDTLRMNPDNKDARYNLEYTLRIRPPRKEVEKSDWEGSKSSVYAILPGIPQGGP